MKHSTHAVAALALALALPALAAAPAAGQTSSVWQNQKISDMRRIDREQAGGDEASSQYEIAIGYIQRMQVYLDKEDRSPRQQKKLEKLSGKALDHLAEAIEADPDWAEPRLMVGGVYYKLERYPEAKEAYQEVLAMDPENETAQSRLASVNWYLAQGDS